MKTPHGLQDLTADPQKGNQPKLATKGMDPSGDILYPNDFHQSSMAPSDVDHLVKTLANLDTNEETKEDYCWTNFCA